MSAQGQQVVILKEGTQRSTGRDARGDSLGLRTTGTERNNPASRLHQLTDDPDGLSRRGLADSFLGINECGPDDGNGSFGAR